MTGKRRRVASLLLQLGQESRSSDHLDKLARRDDLVSTIALFEKLGVFERFPCLASNELLRQRRFRCLLRTVGKSSVQVRVPLDEATISEFAHLARELGFELVSVEVEMVCIPLAR